MDPVEIVWICSAALLAIFIVLPALAVLMRLIVLIFPYKEELSQTPDDAALYGAITSTYHSLYPGKRITKIEVLK